MKLESLTLRPITIPFRVSVKHAAAERSTTESVWVTARSQAGRVGYGEGCPRHYVTGEDLDTVQAFFDAHCDRLVDEIASLDDLREWCRAHEKEIDRNPAAWCAVELAMLDLLAKEEGRSVEELLGVEPLAGEFQYTAVIGDMPTTAFEHTVERYERQGFWDFKIKISGDLARDQEKFEILRRTADRRRRLRVDANNLWANDDEAAAYLGALGSRFVGIEEPLASRDVDELERLGRTLLTPIILDESLSRVAQVANLAGTATGWIINLRVSKMGGLLRSLELLDAARRAGIPVIVGAQVGETSLLTRAALVVAQRAGDLLVAQEGAFGTLLLERDVCEPALMFGAQGVLDAVGALPVPWQGFGLEFVDPLPF